MYPANITRDEARRRSRALEVHSYEVAVDLSGRLPDGTGLERPDATFVSSTVVRFAADEVDTHADLIADHVLWARLDGNDLPAEAFDGEHLLFHCTPGEHVLEVGAVMRYSRTGEGLHRFDDLGRRRPHLPCGLCQVPAVDQTVERHQSCEGVAGDLAERAVDHPLESTG